MELKIGRVIKPHGIRGEVVVEVTTDAPEQRFAQGTVLTGVQAGTRRELTVTAARPHQGRLLLTLDEVRDRTAAEGLRGMQFFAPPREDPDDEGYYDHELVGLKVIHSGVEIGQVTGVVPGPAHNLLEVELTGGKQVLVPFVADIVAAVDLSAGECTITPPDGLLELN